jgi:hypothetical protein
MFPTLRLIAAVASNSFYDDFPDAYIPELWANESIAILEENMVIGNLVHRDFSTVIASYGDTVNTRKPGEFKAMRKTSADSVTVQATTATNIPVVLNQHIHTSFMIKDADQSKSFKDLITEYLWPGMLSVARTIDQILLAQVHQFLPNSGGQLGMLTGMNADDYLLDTRQTMNINKAYETNRRLILGTRSETELLRDSKFIQAYSVGDDGTALREASLGRKYGFDIFMAQNTPYVPGLASPTVTGTVNLTDGYAAGANSLVVDGLSAALSSNSWFTIAGDGTPLRLVSSSGGATPVGMVANRGLTNPVADNAVITVYSPTTTTAAYALGWAKYISTTVAVPIGAPVTFGTVAGAGSIYGVIDYDPTQGGMLLDRPLEETVTSGEAVNIGPAGSYNLAFHKNAIALVNRPLALPMTGTGARSGVANFNNMSMRVTFTYDGNMQGTLVTLDTLMGVKVLDQLLGAVMYG